MEREGDSNPRRQPWQGCTLPLSYSRLIFVYTVKLFVKLMREEGVEPSRPKALDPKSSASASSATLAFIL